MNLPQWNSSATASAAPTADVDAEGCAAPPRGDALLPGARLEEFEIERVLASSGFGIVYLADEPHAARRVVIKEFLPVSLATRDPDGVRVLLRSASHGEAFERGRRAFIEESQLLARCEHPSLVKVLGSWHANGTVYRAMPHYPGHTLLSLRQRLDAPPDEPSLRALLDGVLGALEVLHAEGMVHGGITPTSVLVLPDDHPVLLDGGAARRAIMGAQSKALLTLLEPSFAAPEQTGSPPEPAVGPWTDLYALAAVMHYCVSGVMPGMASEAAAQVHEPLAAVVQRLRARLPSLHVSRQFAAAIDAALAPSPDDRPQSVAEFRALLDRDVPTELPAEPVLGSEPDVGPEAQADRREPALHEAPAATAREASNDPAIGPPSTTTHGAGDPSDAGGVPPLWRPRRHEARLWPRLALAAGLLVAVGAAAWTMLPPSPGPEVLASRPAFGTAPSIVAKTGPSPAAPAAVAEPATAAAALPALPQAPTAAIAPPKVSAPIVAKTARRDETPRKTAQSRPARHGAVGQVAVATPTAKPQALRTTAASPRDACGGRTQFSLYRCMQTQCSQATWQQHAQCKRLRLKDEVE